MRDLTDKQALQYGALASPTPLVLQTPMRGGRFIAEIRIPLDVTEGELALISKTVMCQPARKDSWTLSPAEYITESPPCENLSKQAKERIERGKAKHFGATGATDLISGNDVWRCIYCRAAIAEDAECAKPECVEARRMAENRMGIHRRDAK